jgi:UDP-glucuronate decarboxylase
MRILITGGAGFLGSYLVEKYVNDDNTITVMDDFSTGSPENLKSVEGKIKFIKQNVVDLDPESVTEKFDMIFNLSARPARIDWETNPVEIMLPNSIGNYNLIRLALKNNARYLFTSTSEVYGNPTVVPTPETYFSAMNHLGSRAPYDESKKFAETLIQNYNREYGLKSVMVRIFNAYGTRLRGGGTQGRVITRLIEQAVKNEPITIYGDGSQTRAFTYVTDTIDGIATVMEKGQAGEIYNVGNNKETRVIDLAKMIIKMASSNSQISYLPVPPEEPERRAPDITKISKLGWKPKVELEQGLQKMMESYKN